MSDPESFAARWSRLKRAEAKEQQEAAPAAPSLEAEPAVDTTTDARAEADRAPVLSEAPFDPESLPPIDSITAGSDIKAFLQAGVPKDLTRAALRRAWTADPAIRDFIGLAENQWDFTDPTAMPGFGPLEATDDVRQLVDQAMGRLIEPTKAEGREEIALASESAQLRDEAREVSAALQPDKGAPEEKASPEEIHIPGERQPSAEASGAQSAREISENHGRRTHGGALPK